jgi:hypothetical protein
LAHVAAVAQSHDALADHAGLADLFRRHQGLFWALHGINRCAYGDKGKDCFDAN